MFIEDRLTKQKETSLMVIIQRMIVRYQNIHCTNLDKEMFVLFEKAKHIHRAEEFLTIKNTLE